jgi:hypothetical protein
MQLLGVLALGWIWGRIDQTARAALAAGAGDAEFYEWKLATARYYAERSLPEAGLLRRKVELGSESLMALSDAAFTS